MYIQCVSPCLAKNSSEPNLASRASMICLLYIRITVLVPLAFEILPIPIQGKIRPLPVSIHITYVSLPFPVAKMTPLREMHCR